MTLSPELLAMIKDVKPASDEEATRIATKRGMFSLKEVLSLIARIVAEGKVGREALRPFAALELPENASNAWFDYYGVVAADIRAARAALSALEERVS